MAVIDVYRDQQRNLTVFTVSGRLDARELSQCVHSQYQGRTTGLVLWDFSNASWAGICKRDFRMSIRKGKKYSRAGDKKAFVFTNDVDYGIGRMLEAYTEIEKFQSETRIYKSMQQANEWLFSGEIASLHKLKVSH